MVLTLSAAQVDDIDSIINWLTREQFSTKDESFLVDDRNSLR